MNHIYSIYKITNLVNYKIYIGFTGRKIQYRLTSHIRTANKGSTTMLSNAIRKHNKENFQIECLYQSHDRDHTLNKMEPYFINEYNTFLGEGYNLTSGGDGGPSRCGHNHPQFGIPRSEKIKKRISEGRTGITVTPFTDEHKRKIGKAVTGKNNGMYGKKLSDEHKRKISESNKGHKGWNKGGTSWNKNISCSENTKRKISESKKGKPWSVARREAFIKKKLNHKSPEPRPVRSLE